MLTRISLFAEAEQERLRALKGKGKAAAPAASDEDELDEVLFGTWQNQLLLARRLILRESASV